VGRLSALAVAAESHHSTYDRDLFPHWITTSGACNTREQVLGRDVADVAVNSSCYPTRGSWYSPFDGATHAPGLGGWIVTNGARRAESVPGFSPRRNASTISDSVA
jgi:hypothetical protein